MSIRKRTLERGKGYLSIMSSKGDEQVAWSHGDQGSTAVAERTVKEYLRKGATVYGIYATFGPATSAAPGVMDRVKEVERTERQIDNFDPEAHEILIVPRMAGG